MTFRYDNIIPLLDPDFDNMGGSLELSQIIDPIPAGDEEPGIFLAKHRKRKRDALRYQRYRLRRITERLRNALGYQRYKLQHFTERFLAAQLRNYPRFKFPGNFKCNSCIPYNGHHTPNYWATGQTDCW